MTETWIWHGAVLHQVISKTVGNLLAQTCLHFCLSGKSQSQGWRKESRLVTYEILQKDPKISNKPFLKRQPQSHTEQQSSPSPRRGREEERLWTGAETLKAQKRGKRLKRWWALRSTLLLCMVKKEVISRRHKNNNFQVMLKDGSLPDCINQEWQGTLRLKTGKVEAQTKLINRQDPYVKHQNWSRWGQLGQPFLQFAEYQFTTYTCSRRFLFQIPSQKHSKQHVMTKQNRVKNKQNKPEKN